jgi:hypothetical protein
MNPRLFATLIGGCALIGLLMGFSHQVWWLFVPPIVFGAYFFGSTVLADANRREFGAARSLMPSMLSTNILVTAWNSAIQTVVFFAAWIMSLLFS